MKTQYKDSQFNLSMIEVDKLINATTNLRDKMLIESLYFPALRRFEVINLDIRDVDFIKNRLIIYGKGNKVAPVPIGSLYPQYIHNLKLFIGNRKNGLIFLSNRNRKLEISRLNQILTKVSNSISLKNPNPKKKHVNPHLLRHSQARHLKDMGFSVEFIKNYLRHESIKTTMDTYGTLSLNEMEKIALKMRGIEKQDTNLLK